jgi:hypothetical protein
MYDSHGQGMLSSTTFSNEELSMNGRQFAAYSLAATVGVATASYLSSSIL